MQKEANAQETAELLAVVSISSHIGYSNEQTAFSGCFETVGQIYSLGRRICFFTGVILRICRCQQEFGSCHFEQTLLDTTQNSPGE